MGNAKFGEKYGIANTVGQVQRETAFAIIRRSQQLGLDTLDTAIAYGDSETTLGCFGVEKWKIVSKLPAIPQGCRDVNSWVRRMTQEALSRIKIKRLYGLLLHRPDQLVEPIGDELYEVLLSLKAEGLTEKVGISIYSPVELDELWPNYRFDLIQSPLNILDRRILVSGWADRLKRDGVELHVRSVFLQGLMLIPAEKRPSKFGRWAETWNEWDDWLNVTGLTPIQACLRYVSAVSSVDRIVVGVDSVDQLEEIVAAIDGSINEVPIFGRLDDARLINPASWSAI